MIRSKYYLTIGSRTRFLNFFRQLFRLSPLEALLVRCVKDLPAESLWKRLVPPNYLFPKNSRRIVQRNGIHYDLDINDYVEHAVYFGSSDKGQKELIELANNQTVIIDVERLTDFT